MAYQPFMFEPDCLETESDVDGESSSSSSDENVEVNQTRLGNRDWCSCGNCRVMDTAIECLCCGEMGMLSSINSDKMNDIQCIVDHFDFPIICLHPAVLRTAMIARADIRRDYMEEPISNRSFRYQAYRQFTYWIHNRLGRHVRRVIPSCVVWKICDEFPASDGVYIGFAEADV